MDRGSFCQLLKFCRPSLLEQDIPHQHVLHGEILQRAEIVESRVCDNLKTVPSKISFTFNTWTCAPGDPHPSLTCHFIDAPADHPNVWVLKTDQLIFEEIQGQHTGKNMAKISSHAVKKQPSQDVLRGDVAEEELGLAHLVSSYTLPHQNSQPGGRGRQIARSKVLS